MQHLSLRASLRSPWARWRSACSRSTVSAARGQSATTSNPPAAFLDPGRAAKLASAFNAIDQLFAAFTTREHVPGAVWGIVVDGRLAHAGAAGIRDVATGAPADTNSVFRIASMTKSFTAVAILMLRDEGKLSLDDPAERYVPELKSLPYPTSDAPRVTIRHLMSHAAGFPEDNPWGDQQLSRTDAELTAMLARGIPFSNAPGVAYEYSNYAFAILGRVVTRVSGMPYNSYVRERILKPLGMTSTTLEPAAVPASRRAEGYRWEDAQWKLEPQLPDGAFGAMGGMLTSTRDLGVWVANMLQAWPPRDGAEAGPLKRSSLREMQQIQRPRVPLVMHDGATGAIQLFAGGYGYGLRIYADCRFAHIVAHGGGLPGFGSLMLWLPEYGVGIVAMGNRTYTGWAPVFDSALALLQKTGGLAPRRAQPAPALEAARSGVTRLVMKWDDALADSVAAMNLYLDHSKAHRRAALDSLRATVGACTAGTGWDVVENSLRGQWVMPCERGALRVSITLAPTMPAKVQFFDVAVEEKRVAGICR